MNWCSVSAASQLTFAPKLALVRGELAAMNGHISDALLYYENATTSSRLQGYSHVAAIAFERSAEVLGTLGVHQLAIAALKESVLEWRKFGAWAKIRCLAQTHRYAEPLRDWMATRQPLQSLSPPAGSSVYPASTPPALSASVGQSLFVNSSTGRDGFTAISDTNDDSPLMSNRALSPPARTATAAAPAPLTLPAASTGGGVVASATGNSGSGSSISPPNSDSTVPGVVSAGADHVSTQLNVMALIKSSQLLSSEIELSKLLERYLLIVLQLAGATSGLLFLNDPKAAEAAGLNRPPPTIHNKSSIRDNGATGGSAMVIDSTGDTKIGLNTSPPPAVVPPLATAQLYLECACNIDSEQKSWTEPSIPFRELSPDRFAHSVVEYVLRSGQSLVLDNTMTGRGSPPTRGTGTGTATGSGGSAALSGVAISSPSLRASIP